MALAGERQRVTPNRNDYARRYQARWRNRVLVFFGGQCTKCGINDSRVLQLDHVNGGGHQERIQFNRNSFNIGRNAMTRPNDFQLLCANCNWIKRHECAEFGTGVPLEKRKH